MRLGLGRQGDGNGNRHGRHTTSIVTLIPSKTAHYGTIITKGLSNDVDYESDSQVPSSLPIRSTVNELLSKWTIVRD